ncbi:MAG: bifunctional [glutamate--ammonia ligase]-adenylyl-L-tyrosine phosphorylase/[glutamate--ammonia-ligase] adenylyltransferase [Isosphaeraceae bacterium]|nr:bifunctional [glutamate--ammonia ligase]-adenylyl-L-tyrosine phosphorylase/[glutamate--ammonia-ligase] adenylyltransferase [Isosphaeraceae bacterium]
MTDARFNNAEWLLLNIDDPEWARRWLASLGVRDTERGYRDVLDLARRGRAESLFKRLAYQLVTILPRCPDAGMALTNLDRFVAACPNPEAMLKQLAENLRTTEILVQLFSTSQHFSELLIREPELLDWLGKAERRDRETVIDELWAELREAPDDEAPRLALRRFRQREYLRIGYSDIVRGVPLELTTLDLSHLADACVECAVRLARQRAEARHGVPSGEDGHPARFVVLALGKLGGEELNYSSDIDLIFLYDVEGETDGPRRVTNAEFFARMGAEVVRLLADHTAQGVAYRVDMRLRPEGDQGALARALAATLGYYNTTGRTWERQALIKCRPIAGDLDLGRTFLDAIAPFVYRRYLSAAEISEIKAMKRRIEQRTVSAGADDVEVKTGRGGIRDIEFVVQFLQLLHGGPYQLVRHSNTLLAMARLEEVGCLTAEERRLLDNNYRFLRRVEHRLQTMFDLQTHEMPRGLEERRVLAVRMGYLPASVWEDRTGPAERFLTDYRAKTELNRRILNHLLHDAFRDDSGPGTADPVVDLVLDPNPSPEHIAEVLGKYPFRDRRTAYQNLMALAREDIPFLSQARCRHFLAAIAARLLQAVSLAPDPDMALTNLEKVSASLGAKGVLWELFNFNPPSLRLYVDICATSQFLSEILINNPGMIDDLMDSLVDDRPQPAAAIRAELGGLCKHAEDLAPILLSFRNKEWMRIGTRDILGREVIREVTRELADVAEAIVVQVAHHQSERRVQRYGIPQLPDGQRCRWAILGLGKLGGRELNYHSDLDLVFLYESDGSTQGGEESVSNEQFATKVARRVVKALSSPSQGAPLYAVDVRLRPFGASGPLVVTLDTFRQYFQTQAQSWERLALTRARVIYANGGFGLPVGEAIRDALNVPVDAAALSSEVLTMRRKLEEHSGPNNLKRGAGGQTDIEFLVRYLQLVHAAEYPEISRPNLWDALDALRRAGLIAPEAHADLKAAYSFLRTIESRLRLVHNRGDVDLPEHPDELTRLARRLGYKETDPRACAEAFRQEAVRHAARTRRLFHEIVGQTTEKTATT